MNRTRRRPPYKPDGRTNFPRRNVPGVYLIHDSKGELVYVGYGAKDAYKPLYRHFQQWNDRTRQRTTFSKRTHTVRVIYTVTAKQAARLERALILKHQPKGNPDKLQQHEFTEALADLAARAEGSPFAPVEFAPF